MGPGSRRQTGFGSDPYPDDIAASTLHPASLSVQGQMPTGNIPASEFRIQRDCAQKVWNALFRKVKIPDGYSATRRKLLAGMLPMPVDHWVQYHNPDVMGCGIEECCAPPPKPKRSKSRKSQPPPRPQVQYYSLLTNKYFGLTDPRGDVAWVVGLTNAPNSPVCLGWWFVIADIRASGIPGLEYELIGTEGGACFPAHPISNRPWLRILQGLTGNFEFGFTRLRHRQVIRGLCDAAAEAGCPLPPHLL